MPRTRTIQSLAKEFPRLHDYYYKWRGTSEPHLERDLSDVLADYNYELVDEDKDFEGDYNDLQGYLGCHVKKRRG